MNTYRISLETHSIKEGWEIADKLKKLNKGEVLITEMPEWYKSINDEEKLKNKEPAED